MYNDYEDDFENENEFKTEDESLDLNDESYEEPQEEINLDYVGKGILNPRALVELERLISGGMYKDNALQWVQNHFNCEDGSNISDNENKQLSKLEDTLNTKILPEHRSKIISLMRCYGIDAVEAADKLLNTSEVNTPHSNTGKNKYNLDSEDLKALKELQRVQPDANWNEAKYHKMMKG